MAVILALHGPNLNLLGSREPEVYGHQTLAEIDTRLAEICQRAGHEFDSFQSNSEAALIDRIQAAGRQGVDRILCNPAALTHTSIALRDALLGVAIPFFEIHLSNIHRREAFRRHSYFSDIASGLICGLGALGYELALQAALASLESS